MPARQIMTQRKIVKPSPAVFGNAKKIMMQPRAQRLSKSGKYSKTGAGIFISPITKPAAMIKVQMKVIACKPDGVPSACEIAGLRIAYNPIKPTKTKLAIISFLRFSGEQSFSDFESKFFIIIKGDNRKLKKGLFSNLMEKWQKLMMGYRNYVKEVKHQEILKRTDLEIILYVVEVKHENFKVKVQATQVRYNSGKLV